MKLGDLLEGIYHDELFNKDQELIIPALYCDSRKVEAGGLFVAVTGVVTDGIKFIEHAVTQGARVVVSEEAIPDEHQNPDVLYLVVDDSRDFLRKVALRFYGNPSKEIRAIGITGTNGKTTTTFLLESILHEAEHSCSIIGTVNYRIGENVLPAQNTTPGFLDNQKLFANIRDDGVEYCVMEVSSHALDQGRVDEIDFNVAIFTNLASDHLDYHKTRQNYFEAKAKLFTALSSQATAVINIDDDHGKKLFSRTSSKIMTYGIHKHADVMAQDIELDVTGAKFKIVTKDEEIVVRSPLVGHFNVYNILAATAAAIAEGLSLDKIKKGIEHLRQVPGRVEKVDCQQDYTVLIDYAHTQDALDHVLRALRETSDARIILVFGCGGDRDRSKRAEMGYVASQLATFTIITSDNPRTEDPQMIIDEICGGFEGDQYQVIVDREEAIHQALSMADKGDIVLIAGKGHETYQIFKDRTIKFDERQIIRQYLRC